MKSKGYLIASLVYGLSIIAPIANAEQKDNLICKGDVCQLVQDSTLKEYPDNYFFDGKNAFRRDYQKTIKDLTAQLKTLNSIMPKEETSQQEILKTSLVWE